MLSILLIVLPSIVNGSYYVNLASQILIASIFAMSLNLLVGYAGLTSLGHAGYLGLAAYFNAWLTLALWSHVNAALFSVICTTVISGLFGIIALRTSGVSFLMITLAFGQILWGLAFRWASVTGGDNGISNVTRPVPFGIGLDNPNHFYYFALLFFVVVWLILNRLVNSSFGTTIKGTRDQPRRMASLGYNVWLIRWATFTFSGFIAAIGGLLFVYYQQFISPHSISLSNSAEMLLMVLAGGAGTLNGPIVGAVLILLIKNIVSQYFDRWVILLGVVYIFIVMFVPGGLVNSFNHLSQKYLLKRAR